MNIMIDNCIDLAERIAEYKASSRPNYGKCGSMKRNPGHAFIEPFTPCTKGHERHIPHNQDN